MTRRVAARLLLSGAAPAAALLLGCARREPAPSPTPTADRPNLILYLIDTLRADHLGLYGYGPPTSPVLDALGGGGVVFERAYAMDTRTLGSVPSLLASVGTRTHRIRKYGDRLSPATPTVATALRAAGYDTASFVTNMVAGPMTGLDRGFAHFLDAIKTQSDRQARRRFPATRFFQWVDRIDAGKTAPFFAYVHTAEPHRPYIPPTRLLPLFEQGYRGRTTGYYDGEHGFGQATSPRDVAHVRALYDGEVRLADEGVGQLLAGLEERGLRDHTVIVVTADHGEELRDHGHWSHGQSVYEELMHVPLIVAGPGVPAGRRLRELVQLVDVAPTILEMAGVPRPRHFEGESLVDLIEGRRGERLHGKAIYTVVTQPPRKAVVIQDRWKCIVNRGGRVELYDLFDDPGETRNLAEVDKERAASLAARIAEWRKRTRPGPRASHVDLSHDDTEGLRALGYIK